MESLQGYYNSWPKRSLEDKIALLEKTERKIKKSTADKVADFCLYVLSQIPLDEECAQYAALNEPVRKLTLTIQSKSTSIYFFNLNLTESENVSLIINGKNPYLVIGAEPIKASQAISEGRWSFTDLGKSCIDLGSGISQEACMTLLVLFNQTQERAYALQKTFGGEIEGIKNASERFKVRGPL